MEGLPENIPELEEPLPICILTKATEITRGTTIDNSKLPWGSCFKCILRFSMLKASVDLPRLLWLYIILLHTPLDFHPEANV